MQVNAIPIPAATPAACTATRPPALVTASSVPALSVLSSFGAKLATSMSRSAPELTPSPSRPATTSTSDAKTGAKVGEKIVAKTDAKPSVTISANPGAASIPFLDANVNSQFSANTAASLAANSSPSLNGLNLNSKPASSSDAKPDVKPDAEPGAKQTTHPAPVPGTKPSLPTSVLTATTTSRSPSLLAGASLLAVFEQWGISTPAPALADLSSNRPLLSQARTANLASVTAPAPHPMQPPTAPSAQPQPGPAATSTVASPVPLAAGSRAGAPLLAVFENARFSPSPNLADGSWNPQPLNQQLLASRGANFASVTAPSPLPIPQSFTIPASIAKPGTPNPQSPQDQPAPTAVSAVPISAVSPAADTREIPAIARPDDSRAANASANSPVPIGLPTEPGPKSSALPSPIRESASGDAHLSPNLPPQASAAPAPFLTASDLVPPMPTDLVSPGPISLASAWPTQTRSDSSDPPVPVSPAPTPTDNRFHTPVPTGAPVFSFDHIALDHIALGQSPIVESPSVAAAPFTPAQPAPGSAHGPSPAAPSNPAANVAPASSAPAPTPSPIMTTSATPIPAVPSSVKNNSAVTPAGPKPVNSTAADPAATAGAPALHTAPASTRSPHATTVAAQTASAAESGFASTNNISNNDPAPLIPNLAANSSTLAPITAAMAAPAAASTHDVPSNGKLGLSAQPGSTAASPTADKKSSTAMPPNPAASHDAPFAIASGRDPSPAVTPPAPPASAPPTQRGSDPAPELPKTHQMLDSAPPVLPPARIAPGSAADLQTNAQMNAQMHLGVRTNAFGAVEIHTVVQQSQVGITVHADRDLARWFSSEVSSLESGLNKNHLNLTTVDFDHGRSGIQTATGFQQGQPRQSFSQTGFSQTTDSPSAALSDPASPEPDTASESATPGILRSGLPAGLGETRVNIHV
jgi:hypothetical protein